MQQTLSNACQSFQICEIKHFGCNPKPSRILDIVGGILVTLYFFYFVLSPKKKQQTNSTEAPVTEVPLRKGTERCDIRSPQSMATWR